MFRCALISPLLEYNPANSIVVPVKLSPPEKEVLVLHPFALPVVDVFSILRTHFEPVDPHTHLLLSPFEQELQQQFGVYNIETMRPGYYNYGREMIEAYYYSKSAKRNAHP